MDRFHGMFAFAVVERDTGRLTTGADSRAVGFLLA